MNSLPVSPAESAQFACPECATAITYYDVEGSEYYACPQCHAYFRYSGEEEPKVFGNYKADPPAFTLPLGTVGMLSGQAYRIVGVMQRAEIGKAGRPLYQWLEYQLYQPATKEYVQLAEYQGHWMLIKPIKQTFRVQAAQTRHAYVSTPNASYELYNRYKARVLFAVGEFDWDIEGDTQTQVNEFICPPRMLVQEKQKKQTDWYVAEHIEPWQVAKAFNLPPSQLPQQTGVGAVQPDPIRTSWSALRTLTIWAVALLVLGQVLLAVVRPSQELLVDNLRVIADTDSTAVPGTGKVIVSPSFTLPHQAALQIDLVTTLDNQWLELPVSLVNEQTGQGYEFTKNIEFYQGVESGESWTEGSREADATLSAVPAGRYHLNFYPITEAGPAAPDIQVKVLADPPLLANFFLTLVLVLIYPAFQYWRRSHHETRRWEQSDYGPSS